MKALSIIGIVWSSFNLLIAWGGLALENEDAVGIAFWLGLTALFMLAICIYMLTRSNK